LRNWQTNSFSRQKYVQVCIDDASRIAFSNVMKNERQGCAVAVLKAAIAYYASLGVKVERVMTDIQTSLREWAPTTPQPIVPLSCRGGFTATTGTGLMAVSARCHPSAGSAWPGTTS